MESDGNNKNIFKIIQTILIQQQTQMKNELRKHKSFLVKVKKKSDYIPSANNNTKRGNWK